MTSRAIYLTGTDTGCGKTTVSCILLRLLSQRFARAVGMKPVASGCDFIAGKWQNKDALALQATSVPQPHYHWVNPVALPHPLAPEIAAQRAGKPVTLAPIRAAFAHLQSLADWVVLEGIGGWAAPLAQQIEQADLVSQLKIPVILVVGLRLGCINHARLTAYFLQSTGVPCLGWIGNCSHPAMEAMSENIAILQRQLALRYLGCCGWQATPSGDNGDMAQLIANVIQAYDGWLDSAIRSHADSGNGR